MESSPLAVMQPPPSPGPWGYRHDLASQRPRFNSLGPNGFNRTMKRTNPDYFTAKGSSPTVSLAADLAQNFTIDQSPQLPTPRRSLFTTNIFQAPDNSEGITTPPIWREGVTTPPIPSSSPRSFGHDCMDISPLPHKAPYGLIARVTVQSPTPEPTPETDMIQPCSPPPNPLLESPMPAPERKKPTFPLRPSLTRTKGYSTNTVTLAKDKENDTSPFKFGESYQGKPEQDQLKQCFRLSPVQERRGFHLQGGALRPRQPNVTSNMFSRCNGSPNPGIRKTGPVRPRKQIRRSLSMFESPDMCRQDSKDHIPSGLNSVMDIDDTPQLNLPCIASTGEPNSLPRIDSSTLVDVLNGEYKHVYDEVMVIDCRFEYEFDGGHIDGALNYCEREPLAEKLFDPSRSAHQKSLLVFHCEYSELRAPRMAEFIRSRDRTFNEARYPRLSFPEVYILHGGYSSFYESYKNRCSPQDYRQMGAEGYEQTCEAGLHKIKQRAKLSRAQTFAFGEHDVEDSPTAPNRSRSANYTAMDLETSLGGSRMHARRLASY
ncbi:Rhodanese-like protein [Saccharata proteae CBS 121410]|uniref:M-phase inducer phosphatase n=1 Tax=Saccharata proteae CBS 121410 TaxID=1314787 RepID=A0A9P4HYI9_9PEZI|nr:Rhodanese-like protein [Saccharata proteae CBS 121410]